MNLPRRFLDGYRSAAIVVLNTIVLFVLLNVALYFVLLLRAPAPTGNPITARYGKEAVASVYPSMSETEIEQLLQETWGRPYAYEPFTQFKEAAHRGKYVNVSEFGFRIGTDQGPWPPDPANANVFLFGGSTTFGYGVGDGDTIGSYLQSFLEKATGRKVRVYNFGRGHYYSSQERILFEQLLASGQVPDVAIFIDGLNDFYYAADEPLYTNVFRRVMNGTEPGPPSLLERLPIVRVIRKLIPGADRPVRSPGEEESLAAAGAMTEDELSTRVISRYLANETSIEAIAARYEVQPVFVWQPIPTYKLDTKKHPFADSGKGGHRHAGVGYKYFRGLLDAKPLGESFVWSADLQEGLDGPLYVDRVHYTPRLSKLLAEYIGTQMIERGLLPVRPRS